MTRARAADEHAANMRALASSGALVDVQRGARCAEHDIRLTTVGACGSCAADHHTGEHIGKPCRTCAHCYPTPIPAITHQTHADRTAP